MSIWTAAGSIRSSTRGTALTDAWFAPVLVDYGDLGGGSDTSWQTLATVGYQFNDRWSVQGGWRYLDFEKRINRVDVGTELSGPILGFTMRF